ncbi:hypothetical protein TNCV_4560451 [Trichonephila clavipes]|nr:hypothetical protein TNCV_4560451 [Trichonephila clavipes]
MSVALITTKSIEQQMQKLIRANLKVTADSIATAKGCTHGLAYIIMYDRLNFLKVCARWVSRKLTEEYLRETNGHLLSSGWPTEATTWWQTIFR